MLLEGNVVLELTREKTGSFGDRSGGGTPGPIPNPVVKPSSADGTALEAGWKSRSLPKEPVFLFFSNSSGVIVFGLKGPLC